MSSTHNHHSESFNIRFKDLSFTGDSNLSETCGCGILSGLIDSKVKDLEKLQLAETAEVSLGKQRSVTRDHHVSCTSKRTVID